jgi:uncharacterized protein YjbI with pentapeptide repeats
MPRAPRLFNPPEAPRLEDEVDGRGELDGPTLEQARLVDAELSGARVKGLRLIDVAIERGNLANLVAPEPLLRRVSVTGARMPWADVVGNAGLLAAALGIRVLGEDER